MKQSLANAFSILYNYNIYILISCRKFNRTLDMVPLFEQTLATHTKGLHVFTGVCAISNKAYRPNAHLLDNVMHYNGNTI